MNGVDLSLFTFNFDLSWTTFFLNPDLTVYGRYGTRGEKGMEAYVSISSLKNAMERVLEMHKNYPKNKSDFTGKRLNRKKVNWKTPEAIPAMKAKVRQAQQSGKGFPDNCIRCHQVTEAVSSTPAMARQPVPDTSIWPYPLPDAIGMSIDVNHGTRVEKVEPKSFADKARIKAGDVVLAMNGQAVISLADMQWVLHHVRNKATIKLKVSRDGAEKKLTLRLKGKWRKSPHSWGGRGRSRMQPYAQLQRLSPQEKKDIKLSAGRLAIRMEKVWDNGRAKRAGFIDGDILVDVGGRRKDLSVLDLIAYLCQKCINKAKVPVIILRKDGSGKYRPQKMDLPVDGNFIGR